MSNRARGQRGERTVNAMHARRRKHTTPRCQVSHCLASSQKSLSLSLTHTHTHTESLLSKKRENNSIKRMEIDHQESDVDQSIDIYFADCCNKDYAHPPNIAVHYTRKSNTYIQYHQQKPSFLTTSPALCRLRLSSVVTILKEDLPGGRP